MSRNPAPRKVALLLVAVAVFATSFVLTSPRTASALPASSCLCTYYSDSSYTTEVGERDVYCNGQRFSWGVTSPYPICDCERC